MARNIVTPGASKPIQVCEVVFAVVMALGVIADVFLAVFILITRGQLTDWLNVLYLSVGLLIFWASYRMIIDMAINVEEIKKKLK